MNNNKVALSPHFTLNGGTFCDINVIYTSLRKVHLVGYNFVADNTGLCLFDRTRFQGHPRS